MKKRKSSKATKSRRPVTKKKYPGESDPNAFVRVASKHVRETNEARDKILSSDAHLATLDAALTSAETHLQKLFPKFKPYQVAMMFDMHVQTHLKEELSNIVIHGHRNDDPADKPKPPAKAIRAPEVTVSLTDDGLFLDSAPEGIKVICHDYALNETGEFQVKTDSDGGEYVEYEVLPDFCGDTISAHLDIVIDVIQEAQDGDLLQDVRAALRGLLDQVNQMKDMFPDDDGNIADAISDAEEALERSQAASIKESKLAAFAGLIARMKTEEEFGDDVPYSEDWISTLNDLIDQARTVSGIDPKHEKSEPEDE